MLIIYRKGEIVNQLVAWGADREKRLEELEALLLLCGAIEPLKHEGRNYRRDGGSDDEDDEDDPSAGMRSSTTSTNARPTKNLRQSAARGNDSDSDFEFDM